MSSSSSLQEEQRIQMTFSIPGQEEHADKTLKTFIQTFLWEKGIGCSVERIAHANSHSTSVLFESTAGKVYAAQKELLSSLKNQFQNIDIPSEDLWIVASSVCALDAATIKSTASNLLRTDSSGANSLQRELKDCDDSASLTSSVKKVMKSIPGINWVSRALQASGKLQQRVVYVHYKDRSIMVDVTLKSWDDFVDEINFSKTLNLGCKVKAFYSKHDTGFTIVEQIEHLKDEHHYYVTILDNESLPVASSSLPYPAVDGNVIKKDQVTNPVVSFANMDEFYKALSEIEQMEPDEIGTIRYVFEKEKIRVKHLPRLTDEDLEKYGIAQGGLRKSILAVLGKI